MRSDDPLRALGGIQIILPRSVHVLERYLVAADVDPQQVMALVVIGLLDPGHGRRLALDANRQAHAGSELLGGLPQLRDARRIGGWLSDRGRVLVLPFQDGQALESRAVRYRSKCETFAK